MIFRTTATGACQRQGPTGIEREQTMSTIVDVADVSGARQFLRMAGKPARWSSSRLAVAIGQLVVFSRRQPDTTLAELRAALLGTVTLSIEARAGFSADRNVLLEEFDELIETHGRSARLAEVFL
jgi:hypothetical protein